MGGAVNIGVRTRVAWDLSGKYLIAALEML